MLVKLYIAAIAVAFITSLWALAKAPARYIPIFVVILGADLLLEIGANYLLKPLHLHNNSGFYNTAMLVEFWGYGYYYSLAFENKRIRWLTKLYLFIFPLFWCISVLLLSRFNNWNSTVSVTGSVAMIVFSALMYYQLFASKMLLKLTSSLEFWVATALIVFYSGNFIYLGMLNYLSGKHPALSERLLQLLQILNIIFYMLISFALLCTYGTRNMQKSKQYEPK